MKKMKSIMLGSMALLVLAACGNKAANEPKDSDSTEQAAPATEVKQEKEEKADTIKGPTTVDLGKATVDVPEGWFVKNSTSSSCRLEPLETPKVEKKGNFGWNVYISVWDSEVFKADKFIADDKKVFEETKAMPAVSLAGLKFLYNFYDYEFGKHSVLAAPLPEKGALKIEVGGYAFEDAEVQKIVKTLKLK